jgi:multidrug resistance efflux pump
MDADEIGRRIALLFNPMPDMSGNNLNRLHGEQRRRVERLAAEIVAERNEWEQAAKVEASQRRDALARAERLEAEIAGLRTELETAQNTIQAMAAQINGPIAQEVAQTQREIEEQRKRLRAGLRNPTKRFSLKDYQP